MSKENFRQVLFWILAYFSTLGLSHMFFYSEGQPPLSNSIFTLFVWIVLAKFFNNVFPNTNKRLLICATVAGIFFSACMIFGANIFSLDTMAVNELKTWRNILAGTPFFAAIVIWIFTLMPKINSISLFKETKFFSDWKEKLSVKKYFLISWVLIFTAWIPAFLSQYPGIYGYDSIGQFMAYGVTRDYGLISVDHPLAHNFLCGFCTDTLGNLFGSYEIGMAIYTLIQMGLFSLSMALILAYMFHRGGVSTFWLISWLLFFMFFPLIHIMAISMTKNILFATFFAMMILMFFVATDEDDNIFKRPPIFYAASISVCFLMNIFIHQGIYIFICGMSAGLLIMKGLRVKLFKVMLAVVSLHFIYTNLLPVIIFEVPDNKRAELSAEDLQLVTERNDKRFYQEIVGVPAVQLSRVAVYRKDELSAEELQEISDYFPTYSKYADKLQQGTTDYTRTLNFDIFREDKLKFLSVWKKFAVRYPLDYIDAFGRLTVGEWYPDLYYQINVGENQPYFQYESFDVKDDAVIFYENPFKGTYHEMFKITSFAEDNNCFFRLVEDTRVKVIVIENHTFNGFNWLHKFYQNLAYKYSYERVPVFSMLFSTGFIFWLIVTYIFWAIYTKRYKLLFPVSFLIALWGTLMLGPMELFRYTLPLALSIPILQTRL